MIRSTTNPKALSLCIWSFAVVGCASGGTASRRTAESPLPPTPELHAGRTNPCAPPFEDTSARVATDLVASVSHVCLRTAKDDVVCWGADRFHGAIGMMDLCSGEHAAFPVRLGIRGPQMAVSLDATCTLDEGVISCTSGMHRLLRPDEAAAANGTLDALRGARRIALVDRGVCGVFQDEVRCAVTFGKSWSRSALLGERFAVADPDARKTYAVGVVPLRGVTALAACAEYACAIDEAGTPWCWGRGPFGELGQARGVVESTAPRRVGDLTGVRSIVAGTTTACAVTKEHRAFCWGLDVEDWSRPDATGIVPLPFDDVRSIAVGGGFVCALDHRGAVRCLGRGTKVYAIGPAPAFSGAVEQLASGDGFLCARLRTGAVECLGVEGYLGDGEPLPTQLQNGTTAATLREEPVQVFPLAAP